MMRLIPNQLIQALVAYLAANARSQTVEHQGAVELAIALAQLPEAPESKPDDA